MKSENLKKKRASDVDEDTDQEPVESEFRRRNPNSFSSVSSDHTSDSDRPCRVELMESLPYVAAASAEKEKADNSGMAQGTAEKKPAWNSLSNGDSEIKPVMGASSWPALTETTKASSNKSSFDALKCLGHGSSSSSTAPFSKETGIFAFLEHQWEPKSFDGSVASSSTNRTDVQPSGQNSSSYLKNQRNDFASQSHGGNKNQYQQNSHMNQNGNHNHHQSHGGMSIQEHGWNQNWNPHTNINVQGGFAQPPRAIGTPNFVRYAPPPPPPPILRFDAPYMPVHQYPMVFSELKPLMMYHPHRMPVIEPPNVFLQFQEAPLKTRIMDQVHYYLSKENLSRDEFLRKRMNDEGFVHIQFIASFKRLKALTANIQFIMDSLQGSHVVEVKGYEIRNKQIWRSFLMPRDLRVPFYPSPEYGMTGKLQNMSLERKADQLDPAQAIKVE